MSPCAGGRVGREVGGFRGVAGSERWEERGGGCAAEGRFVGAPACRSSSGSRVEHGSHRSLFIFFINFFFKRPLPAARGAERESGGGRGRVPEEGKEGGGG